MEVATDENCMIDMFAIVHWRGRNGFFAVSNIQRLHFCIIMEFR